MNAQLPRWLYLIAALAFVGTLITQAPVALIYSRVNRPDSGFELYGLDGTLMHGQAQGFATQGHTVAEPLEWHLRPLWLLAGQVAVHVEGTGAVEFSGSVHKGILGGLRMLDLRGQGAFKPVLAAAGISFAPMDGIAHFDIQKIILDNGTPTAMEGTLHIENLAWTLSQTPLPLGDFDGIASTQADGITLDIQSAQGPMDVHGGIRLIAADQTYSIELALKPKPDADPLLPNLLSGLGPVDAQGIYHLRHTGQL